MEFENFYKLAQFKLYKNIINLKTNAMANT
jgi:hypothetical protein